MRRTPRPALAHRILLSILPGFVVVSVATFIIWGDNGLLRQHELRHELSEANEDLRELQRANQSLLRYLRAMEQDPVVMERVAAEELGMSTSGARIYRFATDEDLPRKRPQ